MDNHADIYEPDLNAAALEAALPTLASKLQELSSSLSEDERTVFDDIISSASKHLASIEETDDDSLKRNYSKPISAAASLTMRKEIINLPSALGIK